LVKISPEYVCDYLGHKILIGKNNHTYKSKLLSNFKYQITKTFLRLENLVNTLSEFLKLIHAKIFVERVEYKCYAVS